jgi:osmotically-inducible protein OsmY
MQERERGRVRRTDPRTDQGTGDDRYDEYPEGGRTSMTTRSANVPERQQGDWSGQESGGGWSGYVVPYRYYGPGYRGVGYYSVMYQGADESEQGENEGQYERSGARHGEGAGWMSRGGGPGRGQWGGGFAGRGPKGYQRSDERLREEVSDRLMADDQIDASDIEVKVRGGEVTLTGTVDTRWAKRRAEDCAERVMGVREVMNQIRVEDGSSRGLDAGASETRSSRSEARATAETSGGGRSTDERSSGTNGRRRTTASSR